MPEQSTYPVCLLTPAELATYVALAGLADVNGRVRNVKAEVIMARVLKDDGWQGGTTRAALRKLVEVGLAERVATGYYRPDAAEREAIEGS